MRCYLVTDTKGNVKYAGTQADARAARDAFVEVGGLKKKDVDIEETDIPLAKPALLEFINGLVSKKP